MKLKCYRRRNRFLAVRERTMACVDNNRDVFIVRVENRPKSDGESVAIRRLQDNFGFQFLTVLLQYYAVFMGMLMFNNLMKRIALLLRHTVFLVFKKQKKNIQIIP